MANINKKGEIKSGVILGAAIAIVFLLLITSPGFTTILGIKGNETTIYAGLVLILAIGIIAVAVSGK